MFLALLRGTKRKGGVFCFLVFSVVVVFSLSLLKHLREPVLSGVNVMVAAVLEVRDPPGNGETQSKGRGHLAVLITVLPMPPKSSNIDSRGIWVLLLKMALFFLISSSAVLN